MNQLIDDFLPDYQFRERHARTIRCGPDATLAAVMACDLGRSLLVRALFRLRGLPTGSITLQGMENVGFRILGQKDGRELVIGLIGKFWTLSGGIHRFAPEQFAPFARPDLAKAAFNFRVRALSAKLTGLSTETRVWCPTSYTRRRFRRYWSLIRPFSGLVRIEWLRMVKQQAENR